MAQAERTGEWCAWTTETSVSTADSACAFTAHPDTGLAIVDPVSALSSAVMCLLDYPYVGNSAVGTFGCFPSEKPAVTQLHCAAF